MQLYVAEPVENGHNVDTISVIWGTQKHWNPVYQQDMYPLLTEEFCLPTTYQSNVLAFSLILIVS
jgi:hypothetical protein